MEVGQGPNWGCSAKGKKKLLSLLITKWAHFLLLNLRLCQIILNINVFVNSKLTAKTVYICLAVVINLISFLFLLSYLFIDVSKLFNIVLHAHGSGERRTKCCCETMSCSGSNS
jgi:hypothetical protein